MTNSKRRYLAGLLVLLSSGGDAESKAQTAAAVRPDADAYLAAAKAAVAEVDRQGPGVGFTGLSEAVYRTFVEQAAALGPVLGSAEAPVNSLVEHDLFCGPVVRILVGYQFSGLKARTTGVTDPHRIATITREVAQENLGRSFEKLFPVILFGAHCTGASTAMLESFVRKLPKDQLTPVRMEGLQQVRRGVTQSYTGLLTIAAAPDASERQRAQVVEVLVQRAGEFTLALTKAERASFKHQLGQLAARGDPSRKALLETAMRAVNAQTCGALCAL